MDSMDSHAGQTTILILKGTLGSLVFIIYK